VNVLYCRETKKATFVQWQFAVYNPYFFTNTNSVICKIIVGRGLGPAAYKNAPNGGSEAPLYDVNEGERYMKATDDIDTD
jgi:hypothetical protein